MKNWWMPLLALLTAVLAILLAACSTSKSVANSSKPIVENYKRTAPPGDASMPGERYGAASADGDLLSDLTQVTSDSSVGYDPALEFRVSPHTPGQTQFAEQSVDSALRSEERLSRHALEERVLPRKGVSATDFFDFQAGGFGEAASGIVDVDQDGDIDEIDRVENLRVRESANPQPVPASPQRLDRLRSLGVRATRSTPPDFALDRSEELRGPEAAPPPASLPYTTRSTDELLIIERSSARRTARADDEPGSGCLMTSLPSSPIPVPVPLKHTSVSGKISGFIQTVDVTQTFSNPYDTKIEAVYVFPLPEMAAVSDFVMTVGDRTIRGIIREREQAEAIYARACASGRVASLMTQERANIFTQRVANIEPGKSIDVTIRYYGTLAYVDGAYEFVFPMVVGPRYNPSSTQASLAGDGTGVGAVERFATGASGQRVEVPYLRPDERSAHDISLDLAIDAGVSIERVECLAHEIDVDRDSPSRVRVKLSAARRGDPWVQNTIPNRDFVLRYVVAGAEPKSALIVSDGAGLSNAARDEDGGFFTLMIVPPASAANRPRGPVEMVFVLDCSGSMNGRPMAQAKAAILRGLDRLDPDDTFQLINFSQDSSQLGREPLSATLHNIDRAKRYLANIDAAGGTEMLKGLRACLDFPHDPERLRVIAFVTDGFIGNEADILRETHDRLDESRIFSFGVGSAPNRALMDSMARMGRGAVAYVGLDEKAEDVMDAFMDRVSYAAITNVKLDFGRADVSDVYPPRTPDLFVGRPVIVTGRYEGRPPTSVEITGRQGRGRVSIAARREATNSCEALPQVWARQKLAYLAERSTWKPSESANEDAKKTAISFGLLSAHTAFVAVDSMSKTAGASGVTVGVPVPVPEGVRYETTVTEPVAFPRRDRGD